MYCKHFAAALVLAGALAAVPAVGQPPLPDVKPEFVVNTFTQGNQTFPAVAASPDGTLWITWFENGQPPFGIKARRFAPSGSPLGPELWVHTGLNPATVVAVLLGPRIGATPDGGFNETLPFKAGAQPASADDKEDGADDPNAQQAAGPNAPDAPDVPGLSIHATSKTNRVHTLGAFAGGLVMTVIAGHLLLLRREVNRPSDLEVAGSAGLPG